MKRKIAGRLFVGAVSLCLLGLGPASAKGQDAQNTPAKAAPANAAMEPGETTNVVRGVVALTKSLDAKKAQPGSTFEAKLESNIRLKNGTDLPKGSLLVGQVGTDDMNQNGNSKLALRFTEAKVKGGNSIPIHATIMEVYPPSGFTGYGSGATAGGTPQSDPDNTSFTSQTLKVDQIGAINGVDLHSNVTSQNSGVFVTTKRDDVKLAQGSQLALAISTQNSHAGSGNSN